jgi:hypothetical protein
MIGLRVFIRFSCVHVFPFLITSLISLVIFCMDFLEGFMRSFPLYFLKFQPKKSKPSFIWVICVFSLDSSSPLCFRKFPMMFLISSAISFVLAVTMKSSAYFTKFTWYFEAMRWLRLLFLLWYFISSIFSIPSNVILDRTGEMILPCGVPEFVWKRLCSET